MIESQRLGMEGENAALEYLIAHKYEILDMNWRVRKYEIDIICQKDDEIIFVEVKSHQYNVLFKKHLVVNKTKQRNIISAADIYVRQKNINLSARFDIIVVVKAKQSKHINIEHYPNAFYCT